MPLRLASIGRKGLYGVVALAALCFSVVYCMPIQSNGYSYALHIHWLNAVRHSVRIEQMQGSWPTNYTGQWRVWDRWGRLRKEVLLNEGLIHTCSLYYPGSSQMLLHRLWMNEYTEYSAMTPEGAFLCKWRSSPMNWNERLNGIVWMNRSVVAEYGRFYDFVVYTDHRPTCRIQLSWSGRKVSKVVVLSTRKLNGKYDVYAFSWPDDNRPEGKMYTVRLDDPVEDVIQMGSASERPIPKKKQRFVNYMLKERPPQRQPRDVLLLVSDFVVPQLWE